MCPERFFKTLKREAVHLHNYRTSEEAEVNLQRDRPVQNRILLTGEHEYITFTPTALVGLPETLGVGETATFQIVGDLTILDVTRPATFGVTLTPTTAEQLSGAATATIQFADWGISIPNVPMVAGVSDEARPEPAFEATTA